MYRVDTWRSDSDRHAGDTQEAEVPEVPRSPAHFLSAGTELDANWLVTKFAMQLICCTKHAGIPGESVVPLKRSKNSKTVNQAAALATFWTAVCRPTTRKYQSKTHDNCIRVDNLILDRSSSVDSSACTTKIWLKKSTSSPGESPAYTRTWEKVALGAFCQRAFY